MKLKALFSLILVLLACKTAFAGNAVNQLNVDLSPSLYTTQDVEDGIDLTAEMTFPLGPIVGVGVLADIGMAYGKDDYLDSVYSALGAQIFFGSHDIGRIGFGFLSDSKVYSEEDSYYGDDDTTVSSDSTLKYAEAYLGDFTLGISGSNVEPEAESGGYTAEQPEHEITMYTLQYYPTDNVRLELSQYTEEIDDGATYYFYPGYVIVFEDTEIKANTLGLEFGVTSMVSIFMEYANIQSNNDKDVKSYSVGATIYFRGGDTLKDNDRWY
ncbi:MAG TPA: hypothetical protein VFX02_06290 [Gammaproteobacteria bacterium]|nr:hypothetical protein [Gammaproteobacteria bacterium]